MLKSTLLLHTFQTEVTARLSMIGMFMNSCVTVGQYITLVCLFSKLRFV